MKILKFSFSKMQYPISFVILLTSSLPGKKGIFILISRGETALFKKPIVRFTRIWLSELLDEINGMSDLYELHPKIDALIKVSFPVCRFLSNILTLNIFS